MWWRPLDGQVDYYPAPNSLRIKSWHPFGHPRLANNSTFPLVSRDHNDTPGVVSHAPFLGGSGADLLNGRSTISFPPGAYLNGTAFDWTNNWGQFDVVNPRTNNAPFCNYSDGFLMDPQDHHMFCLCRVYPPAVPTTNSLYTSTGNYSGSLTNLRRPVILGTGLTDYNDGSGWPAIHLQSWTPGSLQGGQLRLVSAMVHLVNDNGTQLTYRQPYVATVPFPLGEWVLLEWATYPEVLSVPREPFGPLGDPITPGNNDVHAVKFRLNGTQVGGNLYRRDVFAYPPGLDPLEPSHNGNYAGSLFSLFAETLFEGNLANLNTSGCWGNVAELMFFPRALNDDEAAKVRAYIMQRFGLAHRLPAGSPYRNAAFIPGSNPITTWSFPGLPPSSRSYTPGVYPATPFVSTAGVERQVRHSSLGYVGDRLSLEFVGLSEVETQQIIDHYELTRGGYEPFGLRPETLVNLSPVAAHLGRAVTRADLRPLGSSWSYADEPEVTTVEENLNNVTVELELLRRPARVAFAAEGEVSLESGGVFGPVTL